MVSTIERLQQELSSLSSQTRLLEARSALAQARPSRDPRSLAVMQQALSERQSDAAQTQQAYSRARLDVLHGDAAPVAQAARRNLELTHRLTAITQDNTRLAARQLRQREQVEDIQRRLNLVRRQLQIGGDSIALANVLRAQQRQLARTNPAPIPNRPDTLPHIAAVELERFQFQQIRAAFVDIDGMVARLAREPERQLSAAQRQSLAALVRQRRTILDLLIGAEERYIDIGHDLRGSAEEYKDTRALLEHLLTERLFWLPSSLPIHRSWWSQLVHAWPWVIDTRAWERTINDLLDGAVNRPIATTLALVFIAAQLAARRPLKQLLVRLARPIGNVRLDSFWLTLRALLITLQLSTPFVLLALLSGWLIRQATAIDTFAQAAAAGIVQLGVLVAFVEPFAQVCRDDGLAQRHFLWVDDRRRALHRSLHVLLALLVLPTLLIALTEVVNDDARRDTIGRAAFMFGSLVIAGFSWRLLHPRTGVLADVLGVGDKAHWRLGYLWLPLAVGVPLVLLGMAAWGYYYTALQLQTRFFYSAGLLGGCRVLYSLIVRWLTVAERRLALARALRKRTEALEARAARESAAPSGDGKPENLDTLEIDLLQISEQTRGLIQIVITLLIGTGLWLIWSNTLPALQWLNHITLWRNSVQLDGKSQLTSITLGALLLALTVGVITFLAGRNLPGFLEITVLRRFSLESGSRYAVATLFQYAIVIFGLLVAVSLIGLRWSSIGWLAAALGVGLGFGLQEIFANFVSGIVILFERPVRLGDTVTVASLTGTVSRVRIRATTITDWDNKEVVIPNKTFITETVVNWTLSNDITRLIISVGVAFDTDTDLAEKLIAQAIQAEPMILAEPEPTVFLVGYGDSALRYEARIFYHSLDRLLPLQHALYKRILAAFSEHGIEFVFPQRDLHVRSVDTSVARLLGLGQRANASASEAYPNENVHLAQANI